MNKATVNDTILQYASSQVSNSPQPTEGSKTLQFLLYLKDLAMHVLLHQYLLGASDLL